MKFLDILLEIYMVAFTIVAAFAVAFAPYIIVMVFGISGWWAMLMFITVPVGAAIIVCMATFIYRATRACNEYDCDNCPIGDENCPNLTGWLKQPAKEET